MLTYFSVKSSSSLGAYTNLFYWRRTLCKRKTANASQIHFGVVHFMCPALSEAELCFGRPPASTLYTALRTWSEHTKGVDDGVNNRKICLPCVFHAEDRYPLGKLKTFLFECARLPCARSSSALAIQIAWHYFRPFSYTEMFYFLFIFFVARSISAACTRGLFIDTPSQTSSWVLQFRIS